jgi:hypothetical protein
MPKGLLRSNIVAAFDKALWQALQTEPIAFELKDSVQPSLTLGLIKENQGTPAIPATITAQKETDGSISLLVRIINADSYWLKLDGSNANQDIDIGSYDFTCTDLNASNGYFTKVGIATTTPTYPLEIQQTANEGIILMIRGKSNGAWYVQDGAGASTAFEPIFAGVITGSPLASLRYIGNIEDAYDSGGTAVIRFEAKKSSGDIANRPLVEFRNNATAKTQIDKDGVLRAYGGYKSGDGTVGISTTFTNGDGDTVTVKNGLITDVS